MNWINELPYFSRGELACKGTGMIKIDRRFAAIIPYLRLIWDESLSPSSFCRTPEHNTNEKGHPNSLHLTENPVHRTDGTMAVDFVWRSWSTAKKLRFAKLAWSIGLSVGLHDGFCHLYYRVAIGLPQHVFPYGKWGGAFSPEDVRV